MPNWITLRRVNNLILSLIILINLYVIAAPFSPAIIFWYQTNHETKQKQALRQKIQLAPSSTTNDTSAVAVTNQPNQVIIPSILLDQDIYEGHETYVELAKGVWHFPTGSSPDKGGNTILVGHRFTYTNPRGVFYELNEIKLGDSIGVIWNNVTYRYNVTSITQVSPSNTTILKQSSAPEITLYTCTPLFVPKYRLVVVAQLEHTS